MGNGKLALVMPTYRFDETARHCIRTLASMSDDDVDVFIGDNSENPEKWDFLRELAARSDNCHVFCHAQNLGVAENWRFLLRQTDHEFIATAHDDDCFAPDYFLAGRDILRATPDCAAANGLFIASVQKPAQLSLSLPPTYAQETVAERIAAYQYWCTSLYYSVHRASAVKRLNRYFESRPFWPSYMDQFMAYTLLCEGKYLVDPSKQIFIYRNVHWGDEASSQGEDAAYFRKAGLPETFIHLNRVCWAADIVHYFHSIYRPPGLADADRDLVVERLFDRMFRQEFSMHLTSHAAQIGALFAHAPDAVGALRRLVYTPWREVRMFLALFVKILHGFNPQLAKAYASFVDASLDLPAGANHAPLDCVA